MDKPGRRSATGTKVPDGVSKIEGDEMHPLHQKKKGWIGKALERQTRRGIAWVMGHRDAETFFDLEDNQGKIPIELLDEGAAQIIKQHRTKLYSAVRELYNLEDEVPIRMIWKNGVLFFLLRDHHQKKETNKEVMFVEI